MTVIESGDSRSSGIGSSASCALVGAGLGCDSDSFDSIREASGVGCGSGSTEGSSLGSGSPDPAISTVDEGASGRCGGSGSAGLALQLPTFVVVACCRHAD